MASSSSISVSAPGLDFSGLLFIVFLVLKLTDVIDWSWWWVTAPLWIGGLASLAFLVLFGTLAYFATRGTYPARRW